MLRYVLPPDYGVLVDGGVTTVKIANLAVTTAKLADAAITPAKFAATAIDPVATVPGARTLGTGAQQAAPGPSVTPSIPGVLGVRSANLPNWQTALANAATTPVDVVVIGDSISSSFTAGITAAEQSWPWILEATLNRMVPSADPVGWRFAKTTGGAAGAPAITSTAGTVNSGTTGAWGSTLTTGQKATFAATMDGVSVVYTKASGAGSLIIRDGIGGTTLATVSTAGTAKAGNVWTSGALTSGARTIEVEASGGTVVIDGMYAHLGNRASGVRVWNAAHEGFTSANFTTPSLALDLISNLTPVLVIIATGTNDDVGNYATRITALVAAVRSVAPSADIALMVTPVSQNLYGAGNFTAPEAVIGRALAATLGLGLIDCTRTIGEHATNGLNSSTDGLHPNANGHRMVADTAASVLASQGSLTVSKSSPSAQHWDMGGTTGGAQADLSAPGGIPAFTLRQDGKTYDFLQLTRYFGLYTALLVGDGTAAPTAAIYFTPAGPVINASFAVNGFARGGLSRPAISFITTTAYTLLVSDIWSWVTRSNAAASTQTMPTPTSLGMAIGDAVTIANTGAGVLTFAAGSGATIAGTATLNQNESATCLAISTTAWRIFR